MAAFLLSGSLDEIALPDVARLLNATQKTGRLAVTSGPAFGSIYFDRGDIIDAEGGGLAGLDGIKHLALFNKGNFEFQDGATTAGRNLTSYPTVEVIRMLENRINEARQVQELMPADRDIPKYKGGAIPAGMEVSAAELAIALKASNGTFSTKQLADELNLDILMVRYTIARFCAAGLMEITGYESAVSQSSEPAASTPPPIPGAPVSTDPAPKYWRGRRIG